METRSENNPTSENAGKHGESDQSQSEVKQKQTKKLRITFDTQLENCSNFRCRFLGREEN